MLKTIGMVSARQLICAALLSGVSMLVAVGCGGGDSGSGSTAGAGGDTSDAGETGEGGSATAGKGGKGGNSSGGSGDAGETGEGGEAGAVVETPAQNHSAVSFVTSAAVSKSKNFVLISGLGESAGGTVASKRSKTLKYTFVPGVIAASTP